MKHWYESKTVWVNVLTLAIMIVSTMAGWDELKMYATEMMYGVAIMNIFLRFITSEGIK
jgi:hypothetical protein